MASGPGVGKCVHCLKEEVERNWDHVFPRSWYPDTTPENLHKWQMPSCVPCNRAHGKIEEDLLARFGLALDPAHPASRGIVDRALRSINQHIGKNERDRRARFAFGQRIMSETLQGSAIPRESVLPGLGERAGLPEDEQVAVLVSKDGIEGLTRKIVRGVFYVEDGKFIEPPFVIDVMVVHEEGASEFRALLDRWGKTFAREPGLVVRRAVVDGDGITSLFEITYWQQFKVYASVTPGRYSELHQSWSLQVDQPPSHVQFMGDCAGSLLVVWRCRAT
jgi:hypothetical protein